MLILDLWGVSFHAAVIFGLGKDFLFKSTLGHCALPLKRNYLLIYDEFFRYNGRLFLSWLQDVDDKWEKIKEQMVLRHHNEAESLNAVQKMDWEWKVNEITGGTGAEGVLKVDDLHIPMVHVSDESDL